MSWTSRPYLARALKTAALLAPFTVAAAVTFGLARWLPPSRIGLPWWAWGAGTASVASLIVMLVERLSRRLLPLVSLLQLTLVFPDRAPDRFRVALRLPSTRALQRRLLLAHQEGTTAELVDDIPVDGCVVLLQLVAALSRHDRLTRGHCERVRAYTDLVIQEMKLPPEQANKLRWAALLHDIGKLTVPAELLSKRGPLTDAEFEVVKTHAAEGLRICAPLAPWLGEWLRAIGEHHERWDGGGYPAGLAGDAIHLGARIVAVTDTFDVITSTRSYKRARSITAARQEITRCAGTQFDPAVVRAFLNVGLHRLRFEAGLLAWFASLAFVPSTAIAPLALNGILGVVATGAGVIPELDRSDGPPQELAFDGQPDELPVLDDPAGADGPDGVGERPTTTSGGEGADGATPTRGPQGTIGGPQPEPDTTTEVPSPTSTSHPGQPSTEPTSGPDITVVTTTITIGSTSTPLTTTPLTTTTTSTTVAINGPPSPSADDLIGQEDTPLTVPTSQLLSNDTDPDADALSVVSVTAFSGGSVSLVGSTVTFVPDPDHNGPAAFIYNLTDGTDNATGVVSISLLPMPDDPVAVPDDYDTSPMQPIVISAPGVLANDHDPDGETLTVEPDILSQPALGIVVTNSDGSFTYTPFPLSMGTDVFTYEVADPTGRTASATVSILIG